ncbi:MAG: hypothetical protein ACF787_00805, partial [Rhodopirellula sp. JB053]
EYVDRVINKSIFDPVLSAQVANGFALDGLLRDYLPSDTESCGYATFLIWRNLEYSSASKRRHRRTVRPVRIGAGYRSPQQRQHQHAARGLADDRRSA